MRRGIVVFAAGLWLWVVARLVGSSGLHIVAVGVALLPIASVLVARRRHGRLHVNRRLPSRRVTVGERAPVEISVRNDSEVTTSFLLLEDALSADLGTPARMVLDRIPPGNRQAVRYEVQPHMRGRYFVGPLSIDLSDPFALTRRRVRFPRRDELLVTPETEPLHGSSGGALGTGSGESVTRQLFRAGNEFYAIREYQTGDDLRRIHWPSVARTRRLMIRQDELARRAAATIFLDTRTTALGPSHAPAFEKAVSAAASIGVFFLRHGFTLRLATTDRPPTPAAEDGFLARLATVDHSTAKRMGMERVQSAAATTTLAVVTAVPTPAEIAGMTKIGSAFGSRIAVMVYPAEPSEMTPEAKDALEGRASTARLSLVRAGWDVYLVPPAGKLRDLWKRRGRVAAAAS